ncbi:MAG: RluA family pseudouridine synthase [Phycisphaeraceae bacterium]|nr:RluA family pseudouridine synthase [Phycisphaeraceae bacterium]
MNQSIVPNERVSFKVRYEDEHLLVVEKRARVATVPGKGHAEDTLLNGLFSRYGARLQNVGAARDFGMLHRLDKPTSGLVLVALTPLCHEAMSALFRERKVAKFYYAITRRAPSKLPVGTINRPILEEHKSMKLARVASGGKPSLTAYRLVGQSAAAALLECRAVTGRLHQVRVHLASIGCPILGDDLYANATIAGAAGRLMLHAHRLSFEHPMTGVGVDVLSPVPRDFAGMLKRVGLAGVGV